MADKTFQEVFSFFPALKVCASAKALEQRIVTNRLKAIKEILNNFQTKLQRELGQQEDPAVDLIALHAQVMELEMQVVEYTRLFQRAEELAKAAGFSVAF